MKYALWLVIRLIFNSDRVLVAFGKQMVIVRLIAFSYDNYLQIIKYYMHIYVCTTWFDMC